jgi:large subunit ribosomal protein L33
MAKPASIKIRLNSSADTGFFYVTKKNARTKTDKLVMKKYDPVVRKHVEFREGKIKSLEQTLERFLKTPGSARAFFVWA